VWGTALGNPDFAALARSYGAHGETVTRTDDFPSALERARSAGKPAVIELQVSPEELSPTLTVSMLRG
jgi:acetolactate synthase-1/2/3 large subunit